MADNTIGNLGPAGTRINPIKNDRLNIYNDEGSKGIAGNIPTPINKFEGGKVFLKQVKINSLTPAENKG